MRRRREEMQDVILSSEIAAGSGCEAFSIALRMLGVVGCGGIGGVATMLDEVDEGIENREERRENEEVAA